MVKHEEAEIAQHGDVIVHGRDEPDDDEDDEEIEEIEEPSAH